MGPQLLVHSLLQLLDVLLVPHFVDGRQAGILDVKQALLDDELVVLRDVDGPEFASPAPVVGLFSFVVEQFHEFALEGVAGLVGMDFH